MQEISFDLKTGNYDPAIADLQDLIKSNPNAPQDEYDQMALSLASAQMQLAEAKRKIPDNAAASAAAGAARDTLVAAMAKFPDDPRLYASLADIYRYSGQLDDAEKLLMSLDQRPKWKNQPQPQIMLSELYDKEEQPDKADQAAETAWTRASNSVETGAIYADLLMQHKKYDKALEVVNTELSAVQAVHGDTSELRRQHYRILIAANRGPEAMAEIKDLLASHPADSQRLEGILGELELNAGQTSDAGAIAAKLLAASPRDVRALLLRAKLEMMQTPADSADAQADLELARQVTPDNMEVLFSLADVYLYRFDAKSATEVLAHALRLEPGNNQLRVHLAYLYSTMEPIRLDQALTIIQDGINQPGGDKIPELANALAAMYQQMGNNDMAIKVSVDALNRMKGNLQLIRPYLELLLTVGNFKTAADQSTEIIRQNQQIWWAWHIRARARAGLGDKAGASSDLDQALALVDAQHDSQDAISIIETVDHSISPDRAIELVQNRPKNDAEWNTLLIMLYHDRGDDDQAIKTLEPLLADASATPAQRAQRLEIAGVIYATAQPKPFADKAFDAYKQLLRINPDDVPALNNIASLCADSFTPPRIEEGLGYIRHAMDLLNSRGASDPMSEDTYGWLLILGGQTEQGMAVLQKAVDRKSFPEGYYHLGEGYLRMNRPEDAQKQVNLALKAEGDVQQSGQPVNVTTRSKIDDLSGRVLSSLRLRTSGNLP
jgi:tetratricopeptide (TPR) repeat protein